MDFTEDDAAGVVAASFADTPDPRLREVMTSLVSHLHAFLRETRPSLAEWSAGIEFLTAVGQQCDDHRQEFILFSDVLGASMLVETMEAARQAAHATASTVLGPFHVVASPERALGDDISPDSDGDRCLVRGRVTDTDGTPVPGARIDVWQADPGGHYDVQVPDSEQRLGNGRGLFTADDDGRYHFASVVPAHYPIPTDGPVGRLLTATRRHPFRPAHIHFLVEAPGHVPVTTHVFVADSPYIDSDAVFAVKESLVRPFTAVDGVGERVADFDIALAPATP
jgi:hydroxyquinol 1,2-dioxygenase